MLTRTLLILILTTLTVISSGCEEPKITFFEVKRIDEPLDVNELAIVVNILETFPPDQLKHLPPIFASLPDWESNRTLSVASLTREENERINSLWDYDTLKYRFDRNRPLQKLLKHYRMTQKQFLGLVRCVGIAMAASRVPPDYDFKFNIRRSLERISCLDTDDRPFATLTPDKQYEVEHLAQYLARRDRCEQLIQVPDCNKELVTKYLDQLAKVMPPSYLDNPIAPVTDWQEEYGVPFQEVTDRVPSDASLHWQRNEKLINH